MPLQFVMILLRGVAVLIGRATMVTWYFDIYIGQFVGTQNVTRRTIMQETQTNGQTFSYALTSMSNLKLLCRMDSIADVKRFVN